MMKKIAMLLLILALAGCRDRAAERDTAVMQTGPTPPASNTRPEITGTAVPDAARITLRMAAYDWDSSRYNDLIKAFEAENPDIQIRLVSLEQILGLDASGGRWPEDANIRLARSADILTTGVYREMAAQGLLLDLRPLMDADASFDPADFYPNALAASTWDGGIYGLPVELIFPLLFFNKDAFAAAGIAHPQPGWTWDDLLVAAQALTIREGEEVIQWGLVEPYPAAFNFVVGRAGPLVDTDTRPPIPRFTDAKVVAAVQWYTDLFRVHQVAPYFAPTELSAGETSFPPGPPGYQLIEQGKAAIWQGISISWTGHRERMNNLGVVPFPVDAPGDHSTPISTQNMAVSAGSQHPEAAWRWLSFLSRQKLPSLFAGDTAVPARRSVAAAAGFWENLDAELAPALAFAVEHSYRFDYTAGYSALDSAIEAIVNGGQSVATALAEAQAVAAQEITEAEATRAAATPIPAVVVVTTDEQAIPADAAVITFITGNALDLNLYRDLAAAFHELHPDIVVELKMPDYSGQAFSLRHAAAEADCLEWYAGLDDPADRAAVLSIEPFLDADAGLNKDDFYAPLVQQFTREGQLWALPASVTLSTIHYNKDLFDAANVPYPALHWTMDDFLETAVTLTSGQDETTRQYGYLSESFEGSDLLLFLERLGAQLVDDSVEPPRLSLTNPETVAAMRWYTSLSTEYAVKPIFDTTALAGSASFIERERLLRDGRAAMWLHSGYSSYDPAELGYREGIVPLPVGTDGRSAGNVQNSTGYFISAHTSAGRACWQWLKFLTAQPTANSLNTALPARISTAESAVFRQAVGEETAAALLVAIQSATGEGVYQQFSHNPWLGSTSWWIVAAYDQILKEGASVEAALFASQELADTYRACIIERDGFQDRRIQQQCLRQTDASLPPFVYERRE